LVENCCFSQQTKEERYRRRRWLPAGHRGIYRAYTSTFPNPATGPDSLLLADLDDWLARKDYRLRDIDEAIIDRFFAASHAAATLATAGQKSGARSAACDATGTRDV
jgi:hypothetical protein